MPIFNLITCLTKHVFFYNTYILCMYITSFNNEELNDHKYVLITCLWVYIYAYIHIYIQVSQNMVLCESIFIPDNHEEECKNDHVLFYITYNIKEQTWGRKKKLHLQVTLMVYFSYIWFISLIYIQTYVFE